MYLTSFLDFFPLKFLNVSLQIASVVAAPLAKTNEIVILSGDRSGVTGEVNRLLAELPVSVNALTGVDLTKVPFLFFTAKGSNF